MGSSSFNSNKDIIIYNDSKLINNTYFIDYCGLPFICLQHQWKGRLNKTKWKCMLK